MKKWFLMTAVMLLTFSVYAKQDLKTLDKVTKETTGIIQQSVDGVSTMYSDGKGAVGTVYTDLKSLAPDAKAAMKEIVETVRKTSTWGWNILVKQQKVWSWGYLLGELLFIYIVYRFWKSFNTLKNEKNEVGETKDINYIPVFLFGICSCVLGYFSFIHLEPMLTGFINPEFGALRSLITLANDLK